jgi:Cof subfamily protein (haloacid dehalogenase superfamily)
VSQKFKGKYIVTDFDGTLAHHGKIPQRNLDAVRYFTENGGLFSINTGRGLRSIREAIKDSDIVINGPLLCCNSALVYDDVNKVKLKAWEMEGKIYDVARFILTEFPYLGLQLTRDDLFLVVREATIDSSFALEGHRPAGDPMEILNSVDYPLQKVLTKGTPERLKELENAVKALPGFDYSTVYTHATLFEILPPGLTKATGVEYAAGYYGISPEDVVVAGDYYNDIEALQIAGLGIAPENALPEVKAAAHRVVCPCADGAIADAIELIEQSL